MDGIIVVNKEKGWTSHDVVAKLRGVLGQKKIGHTGTLDPDATGVLPILLGKATKLSDVLTAEEKTYEAVLRLGVKTTTLDMSGEVVAKVDITKANAPTVPDSAIESTCSGNTENIDLSKERIAKVIASFVGEIDQVPPMYSAIKVDGKKLYELAREGKEIERKSRKVTIREIEIIDINVPLITIRVSCSKGTYIRTLCDDIGEKLGTYAAMQELKRTRSGQFKIEDAFSIEEIENLVEGAASEKNFGKVSEEKNSDNAVGKKILDKIISIEEALLDMPKFIVDGEHEKALLNGNILECSWGKGQTNKEGTLVYSDKGNLIGIYKIVNGKLKPYKMLL